METDKKPTDYKEICKLIGCTGVDPDKCPGNPNCGIIKKILTGKKIERI